MRFNVTVLAVPLLLILACQGFCSPGIWITDYETYDISDYAPRPSGIKYDKFSDQLLVVQFDGSVLYSFGLSPVGDVLTVPTGSLAIPSRSGAEGIAVDTSTNTLWTVDHEGALEFTRTGAVVDTMPVTGSASGVAYSNGLLNRLDIGYEGRETLYTGDYSSDVVWGWDPETGELLSSINVGAQGFGAPLGLDVDPRTARIWVLDNYTATVGIFEPTGTYLGSLDLKPYGVHIYGTWDLAFGRDPSTFYITDPTAGLVYRFDTVVPAPGAILLGMAGVGLVSLGRRFRSVRK